MAPLTYSEGSTSSIFDIFVHFLGYGNELTRSTLTHFYLENEKKIKTLTLNQFAS